MGVGKFGWVWVVFGLLACCCRFRRYSYELSPAEILTSAASYKRFTSSAHSFRLSAKRISLSKSFDVFKPVIPNGPLIGVATLSMSLWSVTGNVVLGLPLKPGAFDGLK